MVFSSTAAFRMLREPRSGALPIRNLNGPRNSLRSRFCGASLCDAPRRE
jgi:hypothetical protein